MNVRRIVDLLRQLADELEGAAPGLPANDAAQRKRKPAKTTPETDAKAERLLRRKGIYPKACG
jgi:hypothetical protein